MIDGSVTYAISHRGAAVGGFSHQSYGDVAGYFGG